MYTFDLMLSQLLGVEYDLTVDVEQFKALRDLNFTMGRNVMVTSLL